MLSIFPFRVGIDQSTLLQEQGLKGVRLAQESSQWTKSPIAELSSEVEKVIMAVSVFV